MDEKKISMTELLAEITRVGKGFNDMVTEGVNVPVGERSTLNFALPNYEDPRIQLRMPARTPFGTSMSFTFGADLDWHNQLKQNGMKLMPTFIQDLVRRF